MSEAENQVNLVYSHNCFFKYFLMISTKNEDILDLTLSGSVYTLDAHIIVNYTFIYSCKILVRDT